MHGKNKKTFHHAIPDRPRIRKGNSPWVHPVVQGPPGIGVLVRGSSESIRIPGPQTSDEKTIEKTEMNNMI